MSTVLLLDNRDSFVWNLAQALQVLGAEVHVVRSDVASGTTVHTTGADRLVISPGPGRPEHAGNSVALVQEFTGRLPILGVCLGHQAIVTALGGSVFRAPPCHGKPWPIHHRHQGLFRDLPEPLQACRYHSLAVNPDDLPAALLIDARTAEGLIMAVRHRTDPTFGVQFHPESFRTPDGHRLLRNFMEVPVP